MYLFRDAQIKAIIVQAHQKNSYSLLQAAVMQQAYISWCDGIARALFPETWEWIQLEYLLYQ